MTNRDALDCAIRGGVPARMFPEARPYAHRDDPDAFAVRKGLPRPRGAALNFVLDIRHAVALRLAGLAGGAEW